jgi:autotransporter-associated beta strand protein
MGWTQGTNLNTDRVEWKDAVQTISDNSNEPYNLNTEYHFVMLLSPMGTSTEVKWYAAPSTSANLGPAKGSFITTNTLASFVNSQDNLGRSSYSADNTANASYDEVRFWNGPINSTMLEMLHHAGPDANLSSLNLGPAGGELPSTTALNITASGATLDLNGINQTVGSLTGVTGSSVLLGSGTLTLGGIGTSTTFSGVISGAGGIIKTGAGAFTLAGVNTYAGTTSINSGILKAGAENVLPSGAGKGMVSISSGATLNLGGFNQTINGLTGSGMVDNTVNGNYSLTVGADDSNFSFSGVIKNTSGNIALVKTGTGTVTLLGANTYAGATSVVGGVLELKNASALGASTSGASVENGASLLINQSLNIGNESLSLNGPGAGNGALHIGSSSVVNYGGAINLADNASIKVDANSTLNLTNPSGVSGLNNSLTFITENGATAFVSGILDLGSGNLIKNSSGTLILAGDILTVGSTSIADGSLQVNSSSASMHDITGDGELIVGDGSAAASLSADSVAVGTLTLAPGARITINPIPGGPLSGPLQSVPEPSSICLLILAASMLLVARYKKIV